jgi:hypothetical protein
MWSELGLKRLPLAPQRLYFATDLPLSDMERQGPVIGPWSPPSAPYICGLI